MKKRLVLSALLGVAAAFSMAQGAFAACNHCTQDVNAGLCPERCCEILGGQPVNTTIDCFNNGNLATALAPGFVLCSNMCPNTALLTATCDAGTPGLNALSLVGSTNYIALANNVNLPTNAAVADVLGTGTPTPANNPNVIAYPISTPVVTNIDGNLGLAFSWSVPNNGFLSSTTGVGKSNVVTTIGPSSRANTFSSADTSGNYVAHVTMSFT